MFAWPDKDQHVGPRAQCSSTCMTTLPLAWGWGLSTVFGVKFAVLNRASTGMEVRIKHSMWLHPESDLFVDLTES